MTDMTAFERQLSGEITGLMGPVRPVNDAAIFTTITATQSPKWRFQSMFNATKFVVAGVIVALFGGFLLSGVLTQPSEEAVPAVGASASATAESEPAPEATEASPSDSAVLPGVFTPTGSLGQGREEHTATLLPDGRVLVVGGVDYSEGLGYVTSVETWDPVEGAFSPAGSLTEGRSAHTATLLVDGRVLVVGGSDNVMGFTTGLASAEIWDPATESSSAASPLLQSRGRHTATLLADGRVLVVGGVVVENEEERFLASAELWDPATESFSLSGSLHAARVAHTATLLPDGRVLVVGGSNPDGASPVSAEVWDPVTESFSPAGSPVQPRGWHSATLLPDGRVLIVGGRGDLFAPAEIWDPGTESFTSVGSLAEARWRHAATLLADGHVLVVGGLDADLAYRTDAEIWDPATDSVVPAASPIAAREVPSLTALPDGRALLVGGNASGTLASAEVWAPDGWRPGSDDVTTTATSPDLLPGVDLATEEVEPGVYRVVSDGVRELSREADRSDLYLGGILDGDIVAGLDGSVWWFGPDGFFRLGDPTTQVMPRPELKYAGTDAGDVAVATDGTLWSSTPYPNGDPINVSSFDGRSWTEHVAEGGISGIEVRNDGTVWFISPIDRTWHAVSRLTDDGLEVHLPGKVPLFVSDGRRPLAMFEDTEGGAWVFGGDLRYHDGDDWVSYPSPFERVHGADVGSDGTLWVRYGEWSAPTLARFDGSEWVTYTDAVPEIGGHYQGHEGWFEAAPDASVWFNPVANGDTECDGVANFDGESLNHFMGDRCIYAMSVGPDGSIWLQAGEPQDGPRLRYAPIHTYVITPEAVAGTES